MMRNEISYMTAIFCSFFSSIFVAALSQPSQPSPISSWFLVMLNSNSSIFVAVRLASSLSTSIVPNYRHHPCQFIDILCFIEKKNYQSKYFSITLDILSLATSLSANTSGCFCFKCLNANLTSSPHNLHFAFPNIELL